jgi:hypothetical protein
MADKQNIDPAVAKLVKNHKCLSMTERGKVHCDVTGHDIVPDVKLVESHLASKVFKKHLEW